MEKRPDFGAIRIADAREYGEPSGFMIEQFSYWNNREPSWAVPAWEERGLGHLEGIFATEEEARKALTA